MLFRSVASIGAVGAVGAAIDWPIAVAIVGIVAVIAGAIALSVVTVKMQKSGFALESAITTTADAARETIFNPALWLIGGVVVLVWLSKR